MNDHSKEFHVAVCMRGGRCSWLDPFEGDKWADLRAAALLAETGALFNEYTRGWANALRAVLQALTGEEPTFIEHPAVDGGRYETEEWEAENMPNPHIWLLGLARARERLPAMRAEKEKK